MSIAKFSLTDCHGAERAYEVTRFTVDENAAFQLMLGEPLIKAVASVINTLVPIIQNEETRAEIIAALPADGEKKQVAVNVQTIARALAAANWQSVAEVLLPLPEMIIAQGGPALVARIFAKTERLTPIPELQGQPSVSDEAIDPNHRQKLGNAADRDQAFGEGNMREYWLAAAMVLVANFSPSGPDGSVSWKGAVSSMTGGIVTL